MADETTPDAGPAFNPDAGEHVESVACRLLAMARERNAEVFCLFNDTPMVARPCMLLEEVLAGWSEGRRRTNETTPDAVELTPEQRAVIDQLPDFALAHIVKLRRENATLLAERARHAEEREELLQILMDATWGDATEDEELATILRRVLEPFECAKLPDCAEAEELRRGVEELLKEQWDGGSYDHCMLQERLQQLLDEVDARDSLLTLQTIDKLREQCARHAEEVERLRRERDTWKRKAEYLNTQALSGLSAAGIATPSEGFLDAPGGWLDYHITQLANERQEEKMRADDAEAELTARRERDADVRACAEYCDEDDPDTAGGIGECAREILACNCLQQPCPECHMVETHKMSCSVGGSKGGRFVAREVPTPPREEDAER